MIDLIKINGEDYGFLFGMEVYWHLTNSRDIEFDEVDNKIRADYNALIDLYVLANKAAIERKGDGNEVTREQIKAAFDEDPELFITVQEKLTTSQVFEKLEEVGKKKQEKKKKG